MFCALSGEAPEVPVLSRVSGNVFEKRLLDSYIAEHGKDPINAELATVDDIIDIKSSRVIRPRPPTATSIPSLLSIFQNEWDSLALETYQIKQQLYQTRQELSTALYQHDAACRVIARITKERDEARAALSTVSENFHGNGANGERMDTDVETLEVPEQIQATVTSTMEQLSAGRKKRKVPEGWTTIEQLSKLTKGDTTSADLALLDPTGPVLDQASIAVHPSQIFVAMSSATKSWSLNSLQTNEEFFVANLDSVVTCLSIHPDGHLIALGCQDGNVYIFHLLTSKIEATFGPADSAVSSVAFSENGFWLAVSAEAQTVVRVWHLGKGSVAAEVEVPEGTKSLAWDYSGQFLACAGTFGLKVWAYTKAGKRWDVATQVEGTFSKVVWKAAAQGLVLASPTGNVALSL